MSQSSDHDIISEPQSQQGLHLRTCFCFALCSLFQIDCQVLVVLLKLTSTPVITNTGNRHVI